jgi:hypothetical protein
VRGRFRSSRRCVRSSFTPCCLLSTQSLPRSQQPKTESSLWNRRCSTRRLCYFRHPLRKRLSLTHISPRAERITFYFGAHSCLLIRTPTLSRSLSSSAFDSSDELDHNHSAIIAAHVVLVVRLFFLLVLLLFLHDHK